MRATGRYGERHIRGGILQSARNDLARHRQVVAEHDANRIADLAHDARAQDAEMLVLGRDILKHRERRIGVAAIDARARENQLALLWLRWSERERRVPILGLDVSRANAALVVGKEEARRRAHLIDRSATDLVPIERSIVPQDLCVAVR